MRMERIKIQLTPQMLARVKALADERGVTVAELCRQGLDAILVADSPRTMLSGATAQPQADPEIIECVEALKIVAESHGLPFQQAAHLCLDVATTLVRKV